MELDIGGFDRAKRNIGDIKIKDWVEDGSIINEQFVIPFQIAGILPGEIFDPVKTIIGRAPVSKKFAEDIGADGFAHDAGAAVKKEKALICSTVS